MKILIIGIVASGKTTLAKRLEKELSIKRYEIDKIVHDDANKIKRSLEEQIKILEEIDKNSSWIIEGTLRKNLYFLLNKADKIIYIDIPLNIRKRRIITRYLKQKLHLEETSYKPTLEMVKLMYKWTSDFEKNKLSFEEKIYKYKDKLIVLKTPKEVSNYKIKI